MNVASLHGAPSRPVLLVVGTWDPFGDSLAQALADLSVGADRLGLDLGAVLFDPAPATFLSDEPWYPFVNDRGARVALLRSAGVAAVLAVDFAAEDIAGDAETFFGHVCGHLDVARVMLGPSQTLGRGDRGNRRTILRIGRERGFRVQTWHREDHGQRDLEVRRALHRGSVAEASALLGRAPLLSAAGAAHRAAAGVPWTWPCGAYEAVEVDGPVSAVPVAGAAPVRFDLHGDDCAKRAVWSRDVGDAYVAVLRGPADADASALAPTRAPRALAA